MNKCQCITSMLLTYETYKKEHKLLTLSKRAIQYHKTADNSAVCLVPRKHLSKHLPQNY